MNPRLVKGLRALGVAVFMCASAELWAQNGDSVIQLDETVISGNQELPKVLYILPWQRADALPNIEVDHDFTESDVFRKLYPPAYRRELKYFDTLQSGKTQRDLTEE